MISYVDSGGCFTFEDIPSIRFANVKLVTKLGKLPNFKIPKKKTFPESFGDKTSGQVEKIVQLVHM